MAVYILLLLLSPAFHQCTTTTTTTTTTANGILVVGGDTKATDKSVEFWSTANPEQNYPRELQEGHQGLRGLRGHQGPEQGSCALNDYPRELQEGPTVNLVSDRLVACLYDTCEIFEDGSWRHLQDTMVTRRQHSSASTADAVLLIGGKDSDSTEWIPVDGSDAQPGPFTVMNGYRACIIQINHDVIVVTGGEYTADFVTKYRLDNGKETPLPPLVQPRTDHACAVYDDKGGDKVLLVTGGWYVYQLGGTEVATYSGGSITEWKEVAGGRLPQQRFKLRAAIVDDIIYVIGGTDDKYVQITSILSWDPSTESWQTAGDLAVARSCFAAVAVPSKIIECSVNS